MSNWQPLGSRTGQTKPREDIGGNPNRTSEGNGEHVAARQGRVPIGAVVAHATIVGQGHCVRAAGIARILRDVRDPARSPGARVGNQRGVTA